MNFSMKNIGVIFYNIVISSCVFITANCNDLSTRFNTTEAALHRWLDRNAKLYYWDRPVKNALKPIQIQTGVYIRGLEEVV